MKIKAIKFTGFKQINIGQDREVKGAIIAVSVFASGMIIGSGFWNNHISTDFFLKIFDYFIDVRSRNSFSELFASELAFNCLFLFFILMTGFSSVGCFVMPVIPFLRGFGYGILSGYLFCEYMMTGIGYYLITVFPSAVIINSVFILTCINSCFSSSDILSVLMMKKQPEESHIKNYFRLSLVYTLLILICTVFDCIIIKAFSVFFTL